MEFIKEFRDFFVLHVHFLDSSIVHHELQKLWTRHSSRKGGIPLEQIWKMEDGASCSITSLLKYLTRRHGLPSLICQDLVAFLTSSKISLSTKLHIATTLKYSVALNDTLLSFNTLSKLLSSLQNQQHDDSFIYSATISQLIQCIVMKLSHDNCDPQLIFRVKSYLPVIDLKTTSLLQNKLIKLGLMGNTVDTDETNKGKIETKNYYSDDLIKSEKSIEQRGVGVLTHVHAVTKKTGSVQMADAVKSQQTVTSVYKHNVSEREQIEAINLSKALNSSKGKARSTQQNADVLPTVSSAGDSVRSYFRTTAMEVDFLYERAKSDEVFCDDDINYLKDKFVAWRITVLALTQLPSTTQTIIAQTLLKISQKQALSDDVINELAQDSFSDIDSDWDNRRVLLLKTFENCSIRSLGKLPSKTESILLKFKRRDDCDSVMKKIIWRTFKKNDNNLHQTFADAVDTLCSVKGENPEAYAEHLEYIAEQVNIEARAQELEEKQQFLVKLLNLTVKDQDEYDPKTLAEVCQIICDYLDHDSSPGLSTKWLKKFVKVYKSRSKSNEQSWKKVKSKFLASILNSILKTVNKEDFEPSSLPDDLLKFLVTTCSLKKDEKNDALILITLGNLVIRFPKEIQIPNAHMLSFRLLSKDVVDENGRVHLKNETENEKLDMDGVTFVSDMTAHVLQHFFTQVVFKEKETYRCPRYTLDHLLDALNLTNQKTTRILCSESLYILGSGGEKFDKTQMTSLRRYAEDTEPVIDVKINCRVVYCSGLNSDTSSKTTPMSAYDLSWLTQIYAFEKLTLDNKDFTRFVNNPILSILESQASLSLFPEQVFQLLTFNLSGTAETSKNQVAPSLKILLAQLEAPFIKNWIPNYCKEAAENVYLSNPKLLSISTKVILTLTMKLGQPLTDAVVEHVFRNLHDLPSNFLILLFAHFRQDVADYIYLDFDLEFASARLLLETKSTDNCPIEIPSFLKQFFLYKGSKVSTKLFNQGLIDILLNAVTQGIMASPLTLYALESSHANKDNSKKALEALTIAAENGQTLSAQILEKIFDNQKNSTTLSNIALALVNNNQSIPSVYLNQLTIQFCSQQFSKIFNNDPVNETNFSILTKLAQNNRPLPQVEQVALKLCQGFNPESGGTHRQRLEILAALSSLVNLGENLELNKEELKKAFVMALSEENGQILETGLHGFIALNRNSGGGSKFIAKYCEVSDLKLLVQIQRRPSCSESVKNCIAEYLSCQKKLPSGFQAVLTLTNLENKSDKDFLTDLSNLVNIGEHEFFQSTPCQSRIQNLLETNAIPEVLCQVLQIIWNYKYKNQLMQSTFEAVTFAMVNHLDFDEIRHLAKNILSTAFDEGVPFSGRIISLLQTAIGYTKDLIWKASNQLNLVDPMLKATLEFDRAVEEKKLTKGLKTISPYLNNLKMDKEHFELVLSGDLTSLKGSSSLANFIARHILKFSVPTKEQNLLEKAGKILEETILSACAKVKLHVFQAYRKLVNGGFVGEFKKVVTTMTEVYTDQNCNLDRKIEMLQTFGSLFKIDIGKPFVAYETIQILMDELRFGGVSQNGQLRKLSIDALTNLPTKNLEVGEGGLETIKQFEDEFVTHLEALAHIIFGEILNTEDNEVIEQELTNDPHFVAEFLQFLYSLQFWDLKSLQGQDRSDWAQILLTSNFLSTFTTSINDQLEILPLLQQISEKYPKKSFVYFLRTVSIKCLKMPTIMIPLLLKSVTQLTPLETMKILNDPEFDTNWQQTTQQTLVVQLLETKFRFHISSFILQLYSERLVQAVGIELALLMISSLIEIQCLASLEELISCIENHLPSDAGSQVLSKVKVQLEISRHTSAELKILVETQILLNFLPPGTQGKGRIERILKDILTNGILMKDILKLLKFTIIKEKTDRTGQKVVHKLFEHTIFQASQYRIGPNLFTNTVKLIKKEKKLKAAIPLVNQFISEGVFDGKYGAKDLEQVVKEFRLANSRTSYKWSSLREKFAKAGYEYELLKLKILQVRDGDKFRRIYTPILFQNKMICDWDESWIDAWAVEAKFWCQLHLNGANGIEGIGNEDKLSKNEFYLEALMVTKQAMKLHRNFHLTFVQILSCLVALQKLEKDKDKGQLQQVATGSGKSAIISILSVIKALEGHTVDVYTSSPVLAERDAKEWQKFYCLFGINCDHNAEKGNSYIKGVKTCYNNPIVYGECSQFQFDYLRHHYSDLGTMAERTLDFAIVDEVDAMFIDDSSKLARLSSTLPGMDLLEIIYHFIWSRIDYLKTHLYSISDEYYYLEGQTSVDPFTGTTIYHFGHTETNDLMKIDNIFRYIVSGQDLSGARIFPVESVDQFVRDHLLDYSKSLIGPENQGKAYEIKLPSFLQDFAVGQIPKWVDNALTALAYEENVHYIVDQGQVKPVDFQTTGVIQGNTNWNNGLHQFLGIKHGLRIQPETVTTNFLSNLAMFKKYGSNILGFTGTLGSTKGREVLYKVYNVKLLTLPETKYKRYRQFPDIVVDSEEEWMREIVISTLEETEKGRGVLVICETISKAELVSQALSSLKIKVKLYTKNDDENQSEKQIERIHPGDVIVSTNLAGRGTDIKTLEIEAKGGLHVCLTFLPQSQRIEDQAFGRTSRQGNKGSGQLIINVQNSTNVSTKVDHRQQRDGSEASILETFETTECPSIQRKDELFGNFCSFFAKLRTKLKSEADDPENLTLLELTVIQSVEERWAMFLRQVDHGIIDLENSLSAYTEFESFMDEELKAGVLDLLISGKNPFYLIQLGQYEYIRGTDLEKSKKYFQTAIEMDLRFSAAASIGQAAIILKQAVGECKEDALKLYREALPLLYEDLAMITVVQSVVERQEIPVDESKLFEQLTEKVNLLGTFINTISSNVDAIERSLRRVHCTRIRGINLTKQKKSNKKFFPGFQRLTSLIPNTLICGDRSIKHWEDFEEYTFTFKNLTTRSDMGTIDQAIETLDVSGESMFRRKKSYANKFQVNLNCLSSDLSKMLKEEVIRDKFISERDGLLSLEIHGLEIQSEMEQLIPFDQISVEIAFFDLEICGDHKNLVNLLKNDEFKKLGLCIELKFVNTEIPEDINHLVINPYSPLPSDVSTLLGIRCIDVRSEENLLNITAITFKVSSSFAYNLTLNDLEKDDGNLMASWNNVLSSYQNIIIKLQNLSGSTAKDLIPILRSLGIDFTMDIINLNLQNAQDFLFNADIDQEKMVENKTQELMEMYLKGSLPLLEIQQLSARGLSILISFSEDAFIPWVSIVTLCALATVQTAAGGLLIATGFGASLGSGLITEAMSDFTYAWTSYRSRQLDWASYGKQKAISMTLTALSMGLSTLKDGAKGIHTLGKTVSKELVEKAGAQAFSTTVTSTGKSLSSLAIKSITVSAGETIGRIGFKAISDTFFNFCFEQLRESIEAEVSSRVEFHFRDPNFRRIISKHWAVDTYKQSPGSTQLKTKIDNIVNATTNPKRDFFETVGLPLCTGILSNPSFQGGVFAGPIAFAGALQGIYKIHESISNVFEDLEKELGNEPINWMVLIQKHFKMTSEDAENISSQLKFKEGRETDFRLLEKVSDGNVNNFFKKLSELQKSFETKSKQDLSIIQKSVVDIITSHIIRVANSHLVSPTMSRIGGKIVGQISAKLQEAFLINEAESGFDQKRVEELKKKDPSELTDEERLHLSKYDRPVTIASQIQANAKDHMLAYQTREILLLIEQAREDSNSHEGQRAVNEVAAKVLCGEPADAATLMTSAKAHKIPMKIVTDLNYKPSTEELAQGVQVVLYERSPEIGQCGHFSLMAADGSGFVDIPSEDYDCGYAIVGHLTGKSIGAVRIDTGNAIVHSGQNYEKILEIQDWIQDRYPDEASQYLLIGGRRVAAEEALKKLKEPPPEGYKHRYTTQKRVTPGKFPKPEDAEGILEAGPSDGDVAPGKLYIYENNGLLKMGRTKEDVATYVGGVEEKNEGITGVEQNYTVLKEVEVNFPKLTERLAHALLGESRLVYTPEGALITGRTEYFNTTFEEAVAAIENAQRMVEPKETDWLKKQGRG